ncbi:MAG: hypothetical protein IPH97_15870 [Ignavibacteriales bacterium]|nr:hypothetical protein [Ignavibacteriales bacterium]
MLDLLLLIIRTKNIVAIVVAKKINANVCMDTKLSKGKIMTLEDFISETLKQIINGIKTAQEHSKSTGATINPRNLQFRTDQGVKYWDSRTQELVENIEFDIAITTIEGSSKKGGLGIFIGSGGIGAQGQSNLSNQLMNRLKFSIPIKLPQQS